MLIRSQNTTARKAQSPRTEDKAQTADVVCQGLPEGPGAEGQWAGSSRGAPTQATAHTTPSLTPVPDRGSALTHCPAATQAQELSPRKVLFQLGAVVGIALLQTQLLHTDTTAH